MANTNPNFSTRFKIGNKFGKGGWNKGMKMNEWIKNPIKPWTYTNKYNDGDLIKKYENALKLKTDGLTPRNISKIVQISYPTICRWIYHNKKPRDYPKESIEQKREKLRNISKKIRLNVLIHYSGNTPKCACCGENNIEFLSIDHINGGGNKHRSEIFKNYKFPRSGTGFYRWLIKNDFPKGFRILCMNCNHSLGHYGYCPHLNHSGS
jgi:hypothetical protein